MAENKPTFIEGVGWRYETKHSMYRRMLDHDYYGRCIYMITISVEGRRPLLGVLHTDGEPSVEPTPLGQEVERCWYAISEFYPEVKALDFQLMPDHVHGLLFVKKEMEAHLGQVVNGFKVGCNRAYRRLVCPGGVAAAGAGPLHPKHPERGLLFETGYNDSVLKGKGQLERMFQYMKDNPRRLAIKRMNPSLFRVVHELRIGNRVFAAIGNRWLLDWPVRLQVRCHNNTTPRNLELIAKQKAYFLQRAEKGAVIVSPCISAGEKEIARAVLDAKRPLIVILENGFPPMYKPPGRYFEACAEGLLLMLAPWPYHTEKRTISRQQCLALNGMAEEISSEPWTQDVEDSMWQ